MNNVGGKRSFDDFSSPETFMKVTELKTKIKEARQFQGLIEELIGQLGSDFKDVASKLIIFRDNYAKNLDEIGAENVDDALKAMDNLTTNQYLQLAKRLKSVDFSKIDIGDLDTPKGKAIAIAKKIQELNSSKETDGQGSLLEELVHLDAARKALHHIEKIDDETDKTETLEYLLDSLVQNKHYDEVLKILESLPEGQDKEELVRDFCEKVCDPEKRNTLNFEQAVAYAFKTSDLDIRDDFLNVIYDFHILKNQSEDETEDYDHMIFQIYSKITETASLIPLSEDKKRLGENLLSLIKDKNVLSLDEDLNKLRGVNELKFAQLDRAFQLVREIKNEEMRDNGLSEIIKYVFINNKEEYFSQALELVDLIQNVQTKANALFTISQSSQHIDEDILKKIENLALSEYHQEESENLEHLNDILTNCYYKLANLQIDRFDARFASLPVQLKDLALSALFGLRIEQGRQISHLQAALQIASAIENPQKRDEKLYNLSTIFYAVPILLSVYRNDAAFPELLLKACQQIQDEGLKQQAWQSLQQNFPEVFLKS